MQAGEELKSNVCNLRSSLPIFFLVFICQNSGLDMNRSTRHHGLVERVYRDRNRITSPHRKPLSVDKHGRQISFYAACWVKCCLMLVFIWFLSFSLNQSAWSKLHSVKFFFRSSRVAFLQIIRNLRRCYPTNACPMLQYLFCPVHAVGSLIYLITLRKNKQTCLYPKNGSV